MPRRIFAGFSKEERIAVEALVQLKEEKNKQEKKDAVNHVRRGSVHRGSRTQ
jgi:hypothetical protein